ncbi:MAG: hypothetical protein LKI94_12985 [Sporolactobacillus sp.]|jgi:hypothetical protein|nr:hypothetical protein [Sporolactobacillus sp.]MCI1883094.1 hypothetical protein [Sporolactobacillus sp.]
MMQLSGRQIVLERRTWSGNAGMMKLAEKPGLYECSGFPQSTDFRRQV